MASTLNDVEDGRLVRPSREQRQWWWHRKGLDDPTVLCVACGCSRSGNPSHFGEFGHLYVAQIPGEKTNG